MRTCSAELERIFQQGPYILERNAISTMLTEAEPPDAFAPALLGDTILRFHWTIIEGKYWRTIYARPVSMEAICVGLKSADEQQHYDRNAKFTGEKASVPLAVRCAHHSRGCR